MMAMQPSSIVIFYEAIINDTARLKIGLFQSIKSVLLSGNDYFKAKEPDDATRMN